MASSGVGVGRSRVLGLEHGECEGVGESFNIWI